MNHRHEMPFGALLRAEGGADFHLWAPAAGAPVLVYRDAQGGERRLPARDEGEGRWCCTVAEATADTRYEWEVDGGQRVADPASRHNPDGPHGASRVTDPMAFVWDEGWTARPWQEAVIYELHVGTFTPEGSFGAARQRLPQLAELGVTAIELMPVAAFCGRFGWGYDGVLPFAPHVAYGTPDELKAFVQAAHRLGMMVFLDVVYNHFGPEGNFLGRYAPQFFSSSHESPWGRALNFDGSGSRMVRDFFIHNALYWLNEFRFDGLRLDAVHAIVDSTSPDIVAELSARVRQATAGRRVHLILENEKNEHRRLAATAKPGCFDAQWNDDFHHCLHVSLTGERHGYYGDYAAEPRDLLARALTHGFVFQESARRADGRRAACAPASAQPLAAMVNYVNNHDQVGNRAFGERLDRLVPPGAMEVALLLVLLTPATPMLFQGDEWGALSPFLYFADWQGELREAVRQGRQREFGHAGTAQRPLPDPCAFQTLEASTLNWPEAARPQAEDRRALVRRALTARRTWITPRQGLLSTGRHRARRIGASGLQICWRYDDGPALMLDVNLGAEVVAPAMPEPSRGARTVFLHNRPEQACAWPAWSARWWLQETA